MSDLSPISTPQFEGLTQAEKAAIVVRFLLSQGADLELARMPDGMQARLTQQMGGMRYVDRRTLAAVMTEFAQELEDIGLAFPSGLAEAISALDGRISPVTAARLRQEAGVKQAGDPWERIAALPVEDLAEIAQRESIEISAVVISKLPVDRAAALLGHLAGPLARKITLAVGRTTAITPDAVERIGLSLASQLDDRPPRAFELGADARLGAILNQANAKTRQDVLDGLKEEDQDFAQGVARNVFTFAHIPARLNTRDIPAVTRAVEPQSLLTALMAAQSEDEIAAREFLLENLSKRMAENLREEMAEADPPDPNDGERAMAEVIMSIQTLVDSGDIKLIRPDAAQAEA